MMIRTLSLLLATLSMGGLSAREAVLVRPTKVGAGATEEQAGRMHSRLMERLVESDYIEVRERVECDPPCEAPRYILASEVRDQGGLFAVYFWLYDRARGMASNTHSLRVKEALFEDLLDLVTVEYVKQLFVFQESGGYHGSKIIEK